MKAQQRTELTFLRIQYTNNDGDTPETVVQGVSGKVSPYESMCILDSSHSGASSILLKVIAGRASAAGVVHGVVKANNTKLTANYSLVYSAFVSAGDSAQCAQLTVRQTLMYAALLRRTDQRSCATVRHWYSSQFDSKHVSSLPEYVPYRDDDVQYDNTGASSGTSVVPLNEIENNIGSSRDLLQRIDDIILMMGLEQLADVCIGHRQKRNLSPSQLRCLTIAVELVNRPSLLFLDNPLADLDWHHSLVVTNAIKTLVAGGRTVICTMNTPTK